MADPDRDSGFLSRWSRRKALVREGVQPAESAAPSTAARSSVPAAIAAAPAWQPATIDAEQPATPETAPPAPTLLDVEALTRESDYGRFVARDVTPEVRNAALKKLFTDPHFNVMDGLDTYIDDYGKPDPLPLGMLRQMNQAHALGLFSDEEDATQESARVAATPAAGTALDDLPPSPPPCETPPDEDIALRLQPHDEPGCPGPAPGAGQDGGREH
jgi:hypothetical protein